MGSPSSRLKTAEKYRPWVDAGLEYVLAPGHAEQMVQQAAAPSPVQQQAPMQQQPVTQHPIQPSQQGTSPAQPVMQQPQGARQSQQQANRPNQTQQPAVQPVPSVGKSASFQPPWSDFLARVKASAPLVVCTYMELGLDLGGQPDARRGDVLRNTLTHHLKWPAGTAAFWPMAALNNGTLQPNPTMFWKGWDLWKSPYIVCFGEEALRVIHPEAQPGASTILLDHVAIHVAPPLSQLISMLPHEQQIAIEHLTNIRIG
jgi:hypothetical protein